MRTNRRVEIAITTLLILHATYKFFFTEPSLVVDLFGYNAIALAIGLLLLRNRQVIDRTALTALLLGFSLWLSGSLLASFAFFFEFNRAWFSVANFLYLCFYPCLVIGLPRSIRLPKKLSSTEFLDAAIVTAGLSSIGAALLIEPFFGKSSGNNVATFFAIFFPIADLILLTIGTASLLAASINKRSVTIISGLLLFVINDFSFLWELSHKRYQFGSLIDDGWLFGLLLITLGITQRQEKLMASEVVPPILITFAIFSAATLLVLVALDSQRFPRFCIAPIGITLLLGFLRMAIALKSAESASVDRQLARVDELTGLANRREFIWQLQQSARIGTSSLLLLDLDGFKEVNDHYGHEVGDELLRAIAHRFLRITPESDCLARLGGDEFAILHSGEISDAREFALALRATLSYPFEIQKQLINIGVSIGVVSHNGGEDLLARADEAMYRAKRQGSGVQVII